MERNVLHGSKWTILPADHPTVLRRLAKEINQRAYNGVYATYPEANHRIIRAKYRTRTPANLVLKTMSGVWHVYSLDVHLHDGAGNTITASRTACGR